MARKQAVATAAAEVSDAPVLDTNNSKIKALIKKGQSAGFVTHDDLNSALPQEELTSEQIEDVMSALSEMGVMVVESAEQDDQVSMRVKVEVPLAMYQIMRALVLMIQFGCICVKWDRLSYCLVMVKLPLPSELRPVEK